MIFSQKMKTILLHNTRMETGINKFNYSYKFRLYPSVDQRILLAKHFGSSRYLYNYFLTKRKEAYLDSKTTLNYYDNARELTELKKELTWLTEVGSQSLQFSLKCLDGAYNRFFKGLARFPVYKSKRGHQSFRAPQGVRIINKNLVIPKFLDGIPMVLHRHVEGDVKFATISRNKCGQYNVSITVEREITPLPKTDKMVGVDLGIKTLAVCSDGKVFKNVKAYRQLKRKKKKLQRRHSKKVKGSKNRERARSKLAKVYQKMTNIRQDNLHKVTKQIIDDNQVIVMETLAVSNMMKNHCLAGAIADCSWYEFNRQLEYKALWYGRKIQRLDRWFPSSKTCFGCGWVNQGLRLKDRTWTCGGCGQTVDRDLNAAKMILKQGMIERQLPLERREVKRVDLERNPIELSVG
jgi:putative transposase